MALTGSSVFCNIVLIMVFEDPKTKPGADYASDFGLFCCIDDVLGLLIKLPFIDPSGVHAVASILPRFSADAVELDPGLQLLVPS